MPRRNKKPASPRKPVIPALSEFLEQTISISGSDALPEQRHEFDHDSAQAIRAALASRRPLLVRGEPGVGKTQLAAAAARVLTRPLVPRVVDSRTESRDLLWTFDAVMRLADAQAAPLFQPAHNEPVGEPHERQAQIKLRLRKELDVADYIRPGPLWWGFNWDSALKQAVQAKPRPFPSVRGLTRPTGGWS